MWPWGHLAVGYLIYTLLAHTRWNHPPRDAPVIALAVGTQFPDLIDKPLAWTFGILPNGRSFTHSLFTALILIGLLYVLVHQGHHRRLVPAYGIGYLSHLGADALHPLLMGEYVYLGFLGWPLVPPLTYGTDTSFVAHFQAFELTSFVVLELGLVVLAGGAWLADGRPGLAVVRRLPRMASRTIGLHR